MNKIPGFDSTDVSAIFTSSGNVPIFVEHAMYRTVNGVYWSAGEEGAAVRAPSTTWHFSEGVTGTWFDTFLLMANPGTTPATVNVTYRLPDGSTVDKLYDVAPESRRRCMSTSRIRCSANTSVGASLSPLLPCQSSPSVRCGGQGRAIRGTRPISSPAHP